MQPKNVLKENPSLATTGIFFLGLAGLAVVTIWIARGVGEATGKAVGGSVKPPTL